MTTKTEILYVLAAHAAAMAMTACPFFFFNATQYAWNSLFAGALAGLNLALIAWMLNRIFLKKSVALVTFVIVIKYALLVGILLLLERFGWRMDMGFVVGLAALFPTLGFIAYRYKAWFILTGQS